MVVSDIVLNRPLPERLVGNPYVYSHCIGGAILREEYLGAIRAAGFAEVEILGDRSYTTKQIGGDPITAEIGALLDGVAASITVLARK